MCSRTGPSSRYAPHFDIEWNPLKQDLKDQVLLPILGDQYGRVLERGEFKLVLRERRVFRSLLRREASRSRRGATPPSSNPALARLQATDVSQDFLSEFQSVITALEHLPLRTEHRSREDRGARP